MNVIGAYEAKTHLSELLERVARGERIIITRHGVPVAELAPPGENRKPAPEESIEQIKAFRASRTLGGLTVRQLIEEGRRR